MYSADRTLVLALILTISFNLAGCVASDSTTGGFTSAPALSSFAGTYRNVGEASNGKIRQPQLSQLIWPEDANLHHGEVSSVEVKALSTQRLKVSALGKNGDTMKAGEYERGKDFFLVGDRLRIAYRIGSAGFKSGEPIIGTTSNLVEFGLDTAGQGKARQTSSATGLAFGLIPMHVEAASDIRYAKLR
jgi:hypothetical protein